MDKKEPRSDIIVLQEFITSYDTQAGTSLSEKSTRSYELLQTELETATGILSLKETWDDAVSIEINGSLKSGIDSMISSCKTPADNVILNVGMSVAILNTNIEQYCNTIEAYNSLVNEHNNMGECPSKTFITETGEEVHNDKYDKWMNNKYRIEGLLQTKGIEIQNSEAECDRVKQRIKDLLSPIGSESATIALAGPESLIESYEGTSVEEFGYSGDEYKISGTVIRDGDGNIVSETYTITNKEGIVVQSGIVTYKDGVRDVEKYIKQYEIPTSEEELREIQDDLEQEGMPTVAIYLNATPNSEIFDSSINPLSSESEYEIGNTIHKLFADGTEMIVDETVTSTMNSQGVLTPVTSVATGVIVTNDGESYDYDSITSFRSSNSWFKYQKIKVENMLLLSQKNIKYVDPTGHDVNLNFTDATTDNVTTTEINYEFGTDYSNTVSVTIDNASPGCGSVDYGDERGLYTCEINGDGNLVETCIKGGNELPPVVVEDPIPATIVVTLANGETTSTPVNLGTNVGSATAYFTCASLYTQAGWDWETAQQVASTYISDSQTQITNSATGEVEATISVIYN